MNSTSDPHNSADVESAASERRCKAGRLYGSQEFRCALDKTHTGDHEAYFTTTDGRRKTIGWKDPRSPMWSL